MRLGFLLFYGALGLASAPAGAEEPEMLADVPAAEAAGYRILDMRHRPSEEYSDLVRSLVAEYARARGVTRPVNASWAPIQLPGGQIMLTVAPLGAEFDGPGDGGRLLVYAVKNDAVADLVLETAAMSVGVRGGEIAAVDEHGFRVFRLQKGP
jgi:hypothetical protein